MKSQWRCSELERYFNENWDCGAKGVLNYGLRYRNGDNRLKMIHWLIGYYGCSYYVASKLVSKYN